MLALKVQGKDTERVIKHKNKPLADTERKQWAKCSHRGRLEGEEEASWSGQVGSVIITAAQMRETKQRCAWKHRGYLWLNTQTPFGGEWRRM